ncbi:TetR/AcrR family transcriptional regulator [Nocardiopsis sp. NPDC006938]|uniref:TetR/AcrR family transcriptional regulator n=1 Tax=Nocardiopsis sp. NPDC006938 TaxID=3364337 RepID=UPI0036CA33AD
MPRVGLTRDTLVSAAADVADEIGFDRLSLAVLAERFGVRDASLYTHVKSLADLKESVALLAHDEWADTLGRAVAGRSGHTALRAFADAYRAFATGHPGRYAATRHPVPPERLDASTGVTRIIDTCFALLRGYELTGQDATDAVRLLRSTCHGFSDLEAVGGFTADRDLDASWRRSIDALHHVLTTWSKP